MFNMILYFFHEKKNVKFVCNNSYTRVFIRPRTVTKLRTLGQLRHRSVANMLEVVRLGSSYTTDIQNLGKSDYQLMQPRT